MNKINESIGNLKNVLNDEDNSIFQAMELMQFNDINRQKIERVVNFVCEKNDIDKTQYNLAPSAKTIDATEDSLSEDELAALIQSMQNN